MLLDLFKQYVPWLMQWLLLFLSGLLLKIINVLHNIRYSGRISEIIDRRRNVVICTIISSILFILVLINLLA